MNGELFPERHADALTGFLCLFVATSGNGNIQNACTHSVKVNNFIIVFAGSFGTVQDLAHLCVDLLVLEPAVSPHQRNSASVKRLEQELGCQLFDRVSNRIYLNDNGRLLQQKLCAVFRDLDSVADELSAQDRDSRQIRLLVRGMRRKITELITQYSVEYSDVSFKIVFDNGNTDFNEYDVIIDTENDRYADLERIELFTMRLRLKSASSDSLCDRQLTLNQLCGQPFVLMDIDGNMSQILTRACNRAGFSPRLAVLCNDIECYEKFIASGMGLGIGREGESPNDGIRDLNVKDFQEHYSVYAYYSQKEYYGKMKNFVEFLRSREI